MLTTVGRLVVFGDADFCAAGPSILQLEECLPAQGQVMCTGVATHLEEPIVWKVLHKWSSSRIAVMITAGREPKEF